METRTRPGPQAAWKPTAVGTRRGLVPQLGGWRAAAVMLAVLMTVLMACGGGSGGSDGQPSTASGGSEVAGVENLAPDFGFTLFQGQETFGATELTLHQLLGKPIVLNFWAGLCPPCRAEMPDLQEFYDEYSDRVILVGIDLGRFTGLGSVDNAKTLLDELDITYPAGYTTDNTVISGYKVLGIPATVFIDADGAIFRVWGGALNADKLREQTNAMLSQ